MTWLLVWSTEHFKVFFEDNDNDAVSDVDVTGPPELAVWWFPFGDTDEEDNEDEDEEGEDAEDDEDDKELAPKGRRGLVRVPLLLT